MCIKGHVEYGTEVFNFGLAESFLTHQIAINPIEYLIY